MRKFLLSTIGLLMTVAMMAVGLNNGADKNNAIDFVWGNESGYQVGTSALWYRVDLNQLKDVENPMIEFTLNLPTASSVAVMAKVEFDVPLLGARSMDFSRSIAGKDTMNFSLPVGDLMKLRVEDVYVQLKADKSLDVSADYYEGTDVIADNCENAINFNWNMVGVHEAGTSAWYKFDVSEVLQNKQHVYLTFTNHSEKTGWVMGELRHSCTGQAISVICPVPAGRSFTKVIDYSFLEASPVEQFYFNLIMTDVTLSLEATTGSALADLGACDNIIEVESGIMYEHAAGTQWYKFTGDLFENEGLFSRVRLVNRSAETVTITTGMTVDCQYTAATQVSFKLPARFDLAVAVPTWVMNQLKKVVDSDVNELYMPITTNQPIAFSFGVEACETAIPFDWTTGHSQEAWTTQWYDVDIASVKANKQQVKLTFTNHSNTLAWVGSLVSLECPFNVAMPLVFPIPAGMSVDKWIDYSYFAATKLDRLYVGVTTEEKISVKAQVEAATVSNPNDCLNAIEVKNGEVYENVGTQWYKFSAELFNDMARLPRFRFATPEGKTNITLGATVGCEYNIATRATLPVPGDLDLSFRFPSFVFKVLKQFINEDVNEFYVEMTSDKKVEWSIDFVYEDACENAIELDLSQPINLDLKANEDVWYKVDLNAVKALGDKNLECVIHNNSDQKVDVEVEVSPTCPVVVSAFETKSLKANENITYTIAANRIIELHDKFLNEYPTLKALADDLVYYVRVRANGDLTVGTDTITPAPAPEGCENAILLDWTKTIALSELSTGWYKFDISALHASQQNLTLSVNNDLGEQEVVGFTLYEDCDTYIVGPLVYAFPVGVTSRPIPYSLIEVAAADIDMLYVYINMEANLPCEDAILFDWNKGAYQEAETTQWYEFDITPVLEGEKQVKLTFTNHSNENAWVIAELALHCPYTKSIPIIVPVPANMSVDKWIDYSVFEASRLEHCYLGVTTMEADIELAASWEDARIEPSEGCLNATKVENDVLYEHAAGTHWYKFTGDLFDKEGHFSRIRVVNRSAETVTITAGATVGCEYNIATRTTIKLPMRFDLAFALPVWVIEQMKKFVDNDVKEFYLELTTDQPIAFSFGQEACETAIPFDWTTGHTQEALTNQWYEVDITSVLENEQQIKLTLTNHSDQTAWVATLVSLDCPFHVAMPLAFPIPAGMSVDKWIDYSYFAATRLDHIFVGVTTTEKISIKAEAQSAVITPTADCINATEILYGSTYVHEGGTAWYKVDGSLFADMDKLPKFQFSTVSGEKTNVTIGATVGCEYNIATRAKVPVPGDVEIAVRVPRFIFKVLREFVDYDVNEFYIEVTTDEKIEFSIDAAIEEDLDACLEAVDLVVTDSMTIDLVANTDMWYKVDLSAVKDLNKDVAVTVTNAAEEAVDVEVEVSPTCPIAATVLKRFTAPASTTATTVLTADRIDELLKEYPNITYYVRVRATGDLHIEVSEPEVVEKEACEEAIEYVWGQPTVVTADSDVWYAIDITEAKAEGKDLFVTVKNIDDIAAVVSAEVLYDCPGVVQHSLTKTIGVGEALSTTLPVTDIQAIESNVLYLHLVTTGDIEVTVGEPEEVEEDACLQAIALNWDEEVVVAAGDTAWYAVNIADAKALQKNIKLTVKNQSAESALVKADIAYDCPVTAFMHSMTKNIGAKMSITTTITYDRFANLETDVLYIRIITTGELLISAEIEEEPIEEETTCEDAVAYELGTVVSLPANADVWYAINIAPAKANQSDLELIINNESELENEANAQISEECPVVDYLLEISAVLEPMGSIVETTTYDTYNTYADVIYLHITTSDSLNFVLREVRTKKYETLLTEAFVCDGTEYIDPITNEKHIISSLIASTQTWSDTVAVSEWLDSVYVYAITPIVAPTPMNETILASIPSAAPQLTPGLVPNVLGSVEAIKDYYAANDNDTIADVDTVYWTEASLNTIVACEATTHTMTLVVEAGCDNRITSSLTFEVVQSTTPDSVEKVTICYGETYTWNGNIYSETGEYTITLSSITGCDSIATLNLTILPEVAETVIDTTICAGETYTWEANGMEYNTSATDTIVMQNTAGCDSVVILQLTVLPAIEETVEEVVICYGEKYLWNDEEYDATGSYTITLPSVLTGCDSVVTLNLLVLPATEYVEDNVVLCAGETYTWAANGVTYNRSINTTFKKKNQAGCDSIVYTLNLTILPANAETVEYATICHGDTYTWNGASYNVSDEYRLTLSDVNGCDSVAVLKLTVLPEAYTVEKDTLVCDGESFTWFDQTCNEAKTYTHVVKNVLGCDSIIYTLNVSMLPAVYEVTTDTLVCDGESFTWFDQICSETKTYTHVVKNVLGCDSIIYTLNVSMLPAVYEVTTDTLVCDGESFTWFDQTCNEAKTYTHVVKNVLGCDSIIYTLNVSMLPAAYEVVEDTTICYGESITWNDQICSESKAYTHIVNNVLGCDSIIYTLNVTVLPEVIIENEELVICESEFPYEWRGEVLTQAGTYTIVEQFAATGCDSVIHTLNLQTYVLTAPATVAEIIAVCGNPIDVTAATADIEAHIASTNLYAPNAVVTWYVKDNGEWTALNSDPIKGSVGEVVLKYVISSDCGSIESNEFELIVEAPTPENDVDMDNVLAVSKYENRVFLLHLNDFATKFGWTPTPEEVTWYKVVNEKDPGIPVDDALVGTGHSYNEPDGSIIKPGEYYAIIVRNELTNPDECQTTMRTVVLTSGVVALSPQLIPNIARPNENLKLINLNPNEVTEIHVYSTTGELMNTYVAEQVAEFMFNAAHASGYYMVDVKTVDGKTTLRYVVK